MKVGKKKHEGQLVWLSNTSPPASPSVPHLPASSAPPRTVTPPPHLPRQSVPMPPCFWMRFSLYPTSCCKLTQRCGLLLVVWLWRWETATNSNWYNIHWGEFGFSEYLTLQEPYPRTVLFPLTFRRNPPYTWQNACLSQDKHCMTTYCPAHKHAPTTQTHYWKKEADTNICLILFITFKKY